MISQQENFPQENFPDLVSVLKHPNHHMFKQFWHVQSKLVLTKNKQKLNKILYLIDQIVSRDYNTLNLIIANFVNLLPTFHINCNEILFTTRFYKNLQYNNLKIGSSLTNGTCGDIYNGVLNGKPVVIKSPKKLDKNFVIESVTHMLLTCSEEKILNKTGLPYLPIPELYNIIKVKNSLHIVMEKLDMNLHTFVYSKKATVRQLLGILIQIAYFLQVLFKELNFVHRDLHTGNIMLKKVTPFPFKFQNHIILCKYKVYFIDFGQLCLNFGLCCGFPDFMICCPSPSYPKHINTFYSNNCFDLKVLLACLYFESGHCHVVQNLPIFYFLQKQFEKYNNAKASRNTSWHLIYLTITKPDKTFSPNNLLNKIGKCIQIFELDSVRGLPKHKIKKTKGKASKKYKQIKNEYK